MNLRQDVSRTLRDGGAGLAIECREGTASWADLAGIASAVDAALTADGLGAGAVVGVLGRNRIAPSGGYLGVLGSDRCAALVNPFQPPEKIAADARDMGLAALLIEEEDEASPAWDDAGAVYVLTASGGVRRRALSARPLPPAAPGVVILVSTSGTTGLPKRIPIRETTFALALRDVTMINHRFGDVEAPGPEQPPLIQYSPLAHIAGALTLARAGAAGRGVVLLDKFDPKVWADVVRRRKPRTTGLPPAMMKMTLEDPPANEDLASLVSVWSGSAPVDPKVETSFSERYGLPVLGNYGATEFCGAVASWALEDHRRLHAAKRGAVGRVWPEIATPRIRSAEGELLGVGEIGVLELQVRRVSDDWMPTTDLAALDDDGFLYLHGRADDAINRGGFKVHPDVVAAALKRHPAVRDAVVVGVDDARLGQVPVAVVESRAEPSPTEAEVIAFVKTQLPAYHAPVAVRIVRDLPRTPLMKVDRSAVRAMFEAGPPR